MKKQDINQETLIVMLNMFIACEFVLLCNDRLKDTDKYRQKLKMHLNSTEKELVSIIEKDYKDLWGADDNALQLLHKGFEQFVNNLSLEKFITHSPEVICDFGTLLVEFHKAPELMLHRLGILKPDESKLHNNKH